MNSRCEETVDLEVLISELEKGWKNEGYTSGRRCLLENKIQTFEVSQNEMVTKGKRAPESNVGRQM